MIEIFVNENDEGQRIDRFLKKYFEKATLSFIYKNLRKKNIKLNDKKAEPEDLLSKGDCIKLYLSDETIEKFKREPINFKNNKFPKIIFEDENMILMNKPAGILSHNDSKDFKKNMVDMMIDYLIARQEYNPRNENSFRPAICNRLDRNTSGILIGAKKAGVLRSLNYEIKKNNIDKFYLALVSGEAKEQFSDRSYLSKDEDRNKVTVLKKDSIGAKESITEFKRIAMRNDYSLLKVNLITGRTHQIRTVLSSKKLPIVGDIKYGDSSVNRLFKNKYKYESQFLHNYSIHFNKIEGELSYLSGKTFYLVLPKLESDILEDIFGDRNIWKS
ncbi:RluA family pseudouridine synthase [Peptoniphilus mikwangii]|uniref:RluA family pseudouridine synthase n=1 Tax=Peptoniphilus mikwangii TaxID=1354300 RepID=UPI000418F1DB|nr:RluA family pseudouridine synthase [Peptoniphilus mikwangii]